MADKEALDAIRRELLELRRALDARSQPPESEPTQRTILELWDEWVPTLDPGSAIGRARPGMRRFLLVPFPVGGGATTTLGALRPAELGEKAYASWMRALEAIPTRLGKAPTRGYLDQIRLAVQACLSWHMVTGELRENPLRAIARDPKRDRKREGYYTRGQLEQLCAAMPAIGADIMRVLFLTLQRERSIRELRKSQVDHVSRDLTLTVKGDKQARVVCPDEAYEIIQRWSACSPGEFVFGSPWDPRGGPVYYTTFMRWRHRAAKATGLTLGGERPNAHHARHGGAIDLLTRVPLPHLQRQLVHSDIRTTERYVRVRSEMLDTLRRAMNAPKTGAK